MKNDLKLALFLFGSVFAAGFFYELFPGLFTSAASHPGTLAIIFLLILIVLLQLHTLSVLDQNHGAAVDKRATRQRLPGVKE